MPLTPEQTNAFCKNIIAFMRANRKKFRSAGHPIDQILPDLEASLIEGSRGRAAPHAFGGVSVPERTSSMNSLRVRMPNF